MLLTTIVFLLVLSTLVLVHELGHFLAARKTGIKVEEFGFGYPPKIVSKKIGETVYSLNWILFGGFVRLAGEELREAEKVKKSEQKRAFWAKTKKARTVVILAGVLANFLLGIFLFSVVYSVSGVPAQTDRVRIIGISPGSPAEKLGLKEDDVIVSLDREAIKSLDRFVQIIDQKKGQEVQVVVSRVKDNPCQQKVMGGGTGFSCQGGNLIFFLTPRSQPPEGEGPLGVLVSNVELVKYAFWKMPFLGIIEGLKETFAWAQLIVVGLGKMLGDLFFRGVVPKDVAGPVGIFQVTGVVAQTGLLNIFRFVAILSVNLAIVNILPLPALDGGRLVFVVYEAITKRRPKPGFEQWTNMVGMALLLLLIILVTINDVNRIVDFNALLNRLKDHLSF